MAASWITGQGVSSRSSHPSAAGRTTPSAKPWTQSRMSFWSWFSSSVNCGPLGSALAACRSTSASASFGVGLGDVAASQTWPRILHESVSPTSGPNPVTRASNVAQIEGAQALGAFVGAVEEAAVDAVVGRRLSPRRRARPRTGSAAAASPVILTPPKPPGCEHRDEVDLGAEDFLHAADVLVAVEAVDVAVEVAAAEFDAAHFDGFVQRSNISPRCHQCGCGWLA